MPQHHWVIEDIKEVRKTGGRSNIPQSSSEAVVKIYQVLKCRCSCCCWALAHMNLWDQPKPTLYLSTPTPFSTQKVPLPDLEEELKVKCLQSVGEAHERASCGAQTLAALRWGHADSERHSSQWDPVLRLRLSRPIPPFSDRDGTLFLSDWRYWLGPAIKLPLPDCEATGNMSSFINPSFLERWFTSTNIHQFLLWYFPSELILAEKWMKTISRFYTSGSSMIDIHVTVKSLVLWLYWTIKRELWLRSALNTLWSKYSSHWVVDLRHEWWSQQSPELPGCTVVDLLVAGCSWLDSLVCACWAFCFVEHDIMIQLWLASHLQGGFTHSQGLGSRNMKGSLVTWPENKLLPHQRRKPSELQLLLLDSDIEHWCRLGSPIQPVFLILDIKGLQPGWFFPRSWVEQVAAAWFRPCMSSTPTHSDCGNT